MATGYYALEHPNPQAIAKGYDGFWGYPTMNQAPRAVVTHTTESLADVDGPDEGAENVANWFQTNDTFALYHTLVDGDSTVRVVPAGLDGTVCHTAFHAAGYNSSTVGVSMALRADSWPLLPLDYRNRVFRRAAAETALLCTRWGLPIVLRTQAEVDAGAKGITGHGILDPGYRSDPGAAFPWDEYLALIKAAAAGTPGAGTFTPQRNDDDQDDDDMPKMMKSKSGAWLEVSPLGYRNISLLQRPWDDLLAGLLDREKNGLIDPLPRNAKGDLDEKAFPILSDSALALMREL